MANETFRTKGAIEPDSSFVSTLNATFRWKGAIEPQPVVVEAPSVTPPTGGLGFMQLFERELEEREVEQRKRDQRLIESRRIDDQVDRDIALLFREKEALSAREAELERLGELVKANAELERSQEQGERVQKAFKRAVSQGNFSAIEALDRELARSREEEEQMLFAIMILLDGAC